jgi:hypothetical protein
MLLRRLKRIIPVDVRLVVCVGVGRWWQVDKDGGCVDSDMTRVIGEPWHYSFFNFRRRVTVEIGSTVSCA